MHATVCLAAFLSAVVLSQATPYYLPQQRQLFYPVVPQYSPYPQYYPRQVYYAPPAAANLIAPIPSPVRYAPPVVSPAKQVLYYPGAVPYPGNVVPAGDEGSEGGEGGGFFQTIFGNFPEFHYPWSSEAEKPTTGAEGGSGGAPAEASASPEKIEQASNSEEPAKEEEDKDKENEAEKPAEPAKVKGVTKGGPQKYVLVQQPQFFGNFGLQRFNPAAVLPNADHGAISSYLLLKNYPGVRFAPQVPVIHQVPQAPQAADAGDAELIPAGQPGAAALGYQKLLQAAQAARQQKEYDETASVVVDAASTKDAPQEDKPTETDADSENTEDEEPGSNE